MGVLHVQALCYIHLLHYHTVACTTETNTSTRKLHFSFSVNLPTLTLKEKCYTTCSYCACLVAALYTFTSLLHCLRTTETNIINNKPIKLHFSFSVREVQVSSQASIDLC